MAIFQTRINTTANGINKVLARTIAEGVVDHTPVLFSINNQILIEAISLQEMIDNAYKTDKTIVELAGKGYTYAQIRSAVAEALETDRLFDDPSIATISGCNRTGAEAVRIALGIEQTAEGKAIGTFNRKEFVGNYQSTYAMAVSQNTLHETNTRLKRADYQKIATDLYGAGVITTAVELERAPYNIAHGSATYAMAGGKLVVDFGIDPAVAVKIPTDQIGSIAQSCTLSTVHEMIDAVMTADPKTKAIPAKDLASIGNMLHDSALSNIFAAIGNHDFNAVKIAAKATDEMILNLRAAEPTPRKEKKAVATA